MKKQTLLLLLLLISDQTSAHAFCVAVFGGSGFIGRRVCEKLVNAGCEVISISRSGQPPAYWATGSWVEKVKWVQADLLQKYACDDGALKCKDNDASLNDPISPVLGKIDSAVSLVGNVRPNPEWVSSSFFGLKFDDDRLLLENGATNERACLLSKAAGSERFVFVSVSYETAKALEGPIPGYLGGKRAAEHAAATAFGNNRTIVVGPSLVYGGKRFFAVGNAWRRFVESSPVRAYLASQDFLRNLSSAPMQDWLEKLFFSPPVLVDSVVSVVCAGALGRIDKGAVPPRRQGFYNTDGKPVFYDDVLFVDGTHEIERLAKQCGTLTDFENGKSAAMSMRTSNKEAQQGGAIYFGEVEKTPRDDPSNFQRTEPPFEGALIGLNPYLYPLPVIAVFLAIFIAIATGQFDAMNEQYFDKTVSL